MTSLCEIQFNKKNIKEMNKLMCRRLVAALYQVRVENNKSDDKEGRNRQSFPEFVPDQFIVLYGVKALAIKNINEFLYGVRANRFRTNQKAVEEDEPLLYFFWQSSHHGVPNELRMSADDFDFYIDLLGVVADVIAAEHTLKMKGGAFWHMFGSMSEIEVPVFVLINIATKAFSKTKTTLSEKLKTMILTKAKAYAKLMAGPNAPKPCDSYHPTLLGNASMDSRGHLPLETFLKASLDLFRKQRKDDAEALNGVYATWDTDGDGSFDTFSAMLVHSHPEISERDVIELYSVATDAEDEGVHMENIEFELRRKRIVLKPKPGVSRANTPGRLDMGAVAGAAASNTASLFGQQPEGDGSSARASGVSTNKWKSAASKVSGFAMIRSLLEPEALVELTEESSNV